LWLREWSYTVSNQVAYLANEHREANVILLSRARIYPKLAIAATIGIALSGLAGTGVAQAATSMPAATFTCSGTDFTTSRHCYFQTENGNAPIFSSNGTVGGTEPPNDKVEITCWYDGNPPSPYHGDGVQDHVVWTAHYGTIKGHIPDAYINEGGLFPYDSPYDLPECS
jgi:hypothetical protein